MPSINPVNSLRRRKQYPESSLIGATKTTDTAETQFHSYRRLIELFRHDQDWYRDLHPAVDKIISKTDYTDHGHLRTQYAPRDTRLLALEMPHVPKDGNTQRVAYWQSDKKQAKQLSTVTSLGKYLRRNFPTAPDELIRDIVGLYEPVVYKFMDTVEGIVDGVQNGPHSCMKWEKWVEGEAHPYQVYDPKFGWKLCIGTKAGNIVGRALVYEDDEHKCFVRAYGTNESGITTNDPMCAWLVDQGYEHPDAWPDGIKLAKVVSEKHTDGLIWPYIDGNQRKLTVENEYLVFDPDGTHYCTSQRGTCTVQRFGHCECCENRVDANDITTIDSEDYCSACRDEAYTFAYGENGARDWYRNDDCIYIENQGEHYASEYLSDNSIIELENGDYVHEDSAVCVNGDWYSEDDVGSNPNYSDWTICKLHDGDYAMRDDSAYCVYTEEWYLEDDVFELTNGDFVSRDNLIEYLREFSPAMVAELVGEDDPEYLEELMDDSDYVEAWEVADEVKAQAIESIPDWLAALDTSEQAIADSATL